MKARIFVIEDNPTNLELMVYLLKAFEYETDSALNGEDGLASISQNPPDLVICDIHLPGKSGYEIVQQLKSMHRTRMIPIIAVTAFAMVGDRDKLLAAGFDGYISKPITPETFVHQIAQFLPTREAPGKVPAIEEHKPSPVYGGNKTTILVVDNSPVNLDLITETLKPFGYQVTAVNGVAEALKQLEKEIPDLILSDLHMPGASGYDLLDYVKKDFRFRAVPFIVITSSVWGDKDRNLCLDLGASRFILRPIEPQELLAEVRGCLKNSDYPSTPG